MGEFILQQDFFLEYIASKENIGLFITLSELNKKFNSTVNLYKENKTIWSFLCKRDFSKWMPENDSEWSLHFQKMKPGDYFKMYCYLNRVLNRAYNVKDPVENFNDEYVYSSQKFKKSKICKEITIVVPLYFVLKKYNSINGNNLMQVPRSTRKVAIIKRIIDYGIFPIVTMKEILDTNINDFDITTLFTHVICSRKKCSNRNFVKSFNLCGPFKNIDSYCNGGVHLKDEDHCSKETEEITTVNYDSSLGMIGMTETWEFDGNNQCSRIKYLHYSLLFSKNKIFSLA